MSTTETERELPRLKARYREEIVGKLRDEFEFGNVMQVPGLVKIVVNMGVGDAAKDSKLMDGAIRDLATVTGQKPQVTKARKSIAPFTSIELRLIKQTQTNGATAGFLGLRFSF